MTLTATQILVANDATTVMVKVPEWQTGETDEVCVRMPDALLEYEIEKIVAARNAEVPGDDPYAANHARFMNMVTWLAHCIIDPVTGERLFGDEQIEALARRNPLALQRCDLALQTLRQQALAEFKALVKKFKETTSSDSGTGSPSTPATSTPTS